MSHLRSPIVALVIALGVVLAFDWLLGLRDILPALIGPWNGVRP